MNRVLRKVLCRVLIPSTVAAAPLLSCKGMGAFAPLSNAACPQLTSSNPLNAQYTAQASVNARIAAFVAAAQSLRELSMEMSATAAEACTGMAQDLGVQVGSADETKNPGSSVQQSCGAVAARIDEILQQGVSGKLRVEAQAPRCDVNAQAAAQCKGQCDVQLTPAEVVARCEPGKLYGRCQGTCHGRCEGTCRGQCEGECSAKNASGQCAGACDGVCNGQCDATCHAECEGEWQAPQCEADIQAPQASADCNAACEARAEFQARCEPARVDIQAQADVEQMAKLVATLRAHLPQLLKAQIGMGKRVLGEVQTVVEIGAELPEAIGEAGAQAAVCVAAAAQASVEASARIRVSVEASAEVSGKVGAGV